jgi:hypothetical protein
VDLENKMLRVLGAVIKWNAWCVTYELVDMQICSFDSECSPVRRCETCEELLASKAVRNMGTELHGKKL